MSLEGRKKLLTMAAWEGLEDSIPGRPISHIFFFSNYSFCPLSNLHELVYTYSSEPFVCLFMVSPPVFVPTRAEFSLLKSLP